MLGNDEGHFCKPTDVAVAESTGHVFVSDGYCNQRVVEFDKKGKFVKQFEDKSDPMLVVHSVTLVEPLNLVCAASREQGRYVKRTKTLNNHFRDPIFLCFLFGGGFFKNRLLRHKLGQEDERDQERRHEDRVCGQVRSGQSSLARSIR